MNSIQPVDNPPFRTAAWVALAVTFWTVPAPGATLEVGPGRPFGRIEEASAKAGPGDLILVYRLENGQPYRQTAVYVRQKNLTFRGVADPGPGRVRISGEGFDYSGRGSTPRAIFQFNQGTDGCVLEGFELADAHNGSHNGAGVRINQANHVTVRNCEIHNNDMGIMSGGDGTLQSAVDQVIEFCHVHHNGNFEHPGYNHNFYLGGTSVTLRSCDVHSSLTGHNVKSRAHHTRVEYCYVHHSANREFDLVDAADTAGPDSHAVLLGNVIVKDPACKGNKGVIHFGQDGGGEHDGTLYLVCNTIVTPFITPVVSLSAPGAKAHWIGNFVSDGGIKQADQQVAGGDHGASVLNVTGEHNWFSGGFSPPEGARFDPAMNLFLRVTAPAFVDPANDNYRLVDGVAQKATIGPSAADIVVPATPGAQRSSEKSLVAWQYRHPCGREPRPAETRLTPGAYGR